MDGRGEGQIALIGGIALDKDENVYVTDKVAGKITKFNKEGIYQSSFGKLSDALDDFLRPKGIDIDKEGRIWVVDASTNVAKIYNSEGRLLLFFGLADPAKSQPGC